MLYYTGLCKWELFVALFMYIKPYLQVTGKSSLSAFQQLLTLMRLHLNHSFIDHVTAFSNSSINICDSVVPFEWFWILYYLLTKCISYFIIIISWLLLYINYKDSFDLHHTWLITIHRLISQNLMDLYPTISVQLFFVMHLCFGVLNWIITRQK